MIGIDEHGQPTDETYQDWAEANDHAGDGQDHDEHCVGTACLYDEDDNRYTGECIHCPCCGCPSCSRQHESEIPAKRHRAKREYPRVLGGLHGL